jgi:hypothetical protein
VQLGEKMSDKGDLGSDASSGFSDDSSSLGLEDSSGEEKDEWDNVPNLVCRL